MNPNPSLRAQLLATEHWSLLATRGNAQSEILSRISTFLMLVSSSIVGMALVGQVTHFDSRFITFALVLVGMLAVIGALTQMRVANGSIEDLAHVIGMNRLRAAYVEMDPAVAQFLVTSAHDDDRGLWQTYNHLAGPRAILQPLASSGTFITFITCGLAGGFGALVTIALNGPGPLAWLVAVGCGICYLGASIALGMRQYRRLGRRTVLFPNTDVATTRKSAGGLTSVGRIGAVTASENLT